MASLDKVSQLCLNSCYRQANARYAAVGRTQISCSSVEFIKINPPSGQTCVQYLNKFIDMNGGYLTNPNATSQCNFCQYRTTDQFLQSRNVFYDNRWRSLGIFIGFTAFNVSCASSSFALPDRFVGAGGSHLHHNLFLPSTDWFAP